jgi:hypothetical protein
MLWQHPELCVPEAMKDSNVGAAVSQTPFISPIVSGGGVYFSRKVTNTDPNFEGILGFPTTGTPEAGDLMYDEISRWVAAVTQGILLRAPRISQRRSRLSCPGPRSTRPVLVDVAEHESGTS